MTMPVSTGTGSQAIKPVPKKRIPSMAKPATTLMSWEETPNWSAMPLREMLPLTGRQPKSAEAKLPAA